MKRSIEWVDCLFDGSREDHVIVPSEVQDLVQRVRTEALDTVELWVRKYLSESASASDSAFIGHMVKMIQTCREQNS